MIDHVFVQSLIEEINRKYRVDLELVGSWATQGFSAHDIDLATNLVCDERLIPACLEIAQRTNYHVDLFINQIHEFNQYCVRPDGDHYWWVDRAEEAGA